MIFRAQKAYVDEIFSAAAAVKFLRKKNSSQIMCLRILARKSRFFTPVSLKNLVYISAKGAFKKVIGLVGRKGMS